MTNAAIVQAKADAIPRYAQPMEACPEEATEGPKTGACWNCDHMVEVEIDGRKYRLCVVERDVSADGDVHECDPEVTDCMDWDEYKWA